MFQAALFFTNIFVGIVEFLIGFRILLKLFSATPATPFVQWIYEMSTPLLAPFQEILPSQQLEGGMIIEFSALFALIIYSFVGYFIVSTIHRFNTQLEKTKA